MPFPTREEYMDGKVTFAEFYTSVANEAGVSYFAPTFLDRVRIALAAGDELLNSIPLDTWDRLATGAALTIQSALKKHGDSYSKAGGVCVMKQAAKNAVGK
jgi:hypothetical protein